MHHQKRNTSKRVLEKFVFDRSKNEESTGTLFITNPDIIDVTDTKLNTQTTFISVIIGS
jgi:hypothetical protein